MVAKILTKSGWVWGHIIKSERGDEFVPPSGKRYPIDSDGNVNYNGEVCKVMIITA